jgi:hypothetical protein
MVISPSLAWPVSLMAGCALSVLLYFREDTYKMNPWARMLMALLRGLGTALIVFLLLAPLFKSIRTEIKKPLIAFAQDNSQSIASSWSPENQARYKKSIENLENDLSKEFEIIRFTFGEKITENGAMDLTERATDISAAMDHIVNQTAGLHLGAIVLATDGSFNQGRNPQYAHPGLAVPVYSIALGDSTVKRDLAVTRVLHNSIVYLEDQFELQIELKAFRCANEKFTLAVYRIDGDREVLVKSEAMSINQSDWYLNQRMILDAPKAGTIRYIVRAGTLANEYSRENNSKEFYIDVLDARQKIALLHDAPHPDLATIKKIIEGNKNLLVETILFSNQSLNWNDYSMILFHQLPSRTKDISAVLRDINKVKKPRMFILGSASDIPRFNASQTILKINGDSKNMNEVTALVKESFSLFTPDPGWKEYLGQYPPLSAPFGEYQVSPGSQTLLVQKIGNIATNFPLLTIGEDQGSRTAFLTAEGIWKWRYYNYLEQKNFNVVDDLLQKIIQYIGIKEDKRKFRVYSPQKVYLENQPIVFDAQLFNDSYEPINTDDVFINIVSSDKKEYQFVFTKTNQAYTLQAGIFPTGNYTYTAYVIQEGNRLEAKGQFAVQRIQLETYQNTADHNLLRLLAAESGGQVIPPDQVESIAEIIRKNQSIKPMQFSNERSYPIIEYKWLFFVAALLFCLEWFLRRYWGGY